VFNILWRADIDPSALRVQFQKASAVRTATQLLLTKRRGCWLSLNGIDTPNNYLHRNHPVQQLIFGKIAELFTMPAEEFIRLTMTVALRLILIQPGRMATLYASSSNLDMERIVR